MVARLEHGAEGVDRSHPAGENSRSKTAFKCSQVFFEAVAGRVRHPRVFVSLVFPDLLLDVGGRRVNRRSYSASFLVGLLTGMDGARGKSIRLVFRHIVGTVLGQNTLSWPAETQPLPPGTYPHCYNALFPVSL